MNMPGDPLSRPLIEIARDLRERQVSARDVVEAAIARHERFGERLHAYSFWAPDQARAVAAAADAAFSAGVSTGPLQGLPVTIGRWSTEGVVPLSFTFDTPGLLARSVCDLAYGFAALDRARNRARSDQGTHWRRRPVPMARLRSGDRRNRAASRRRTRKRWRRRARSDPARGRGGVRRVSRRRAERGRVAQFSRSRAAGMARSARPANRAGRAQRRKPERAGLPGACRTARRSRTGRSAAA